MSFTDQDFYLRFKAEKGLKAKGLDTRPEYVARLKDEYQIISKMGFSSYFLVVADYVNWAKDNDIPVGPGRGSGVGSLVAYCLGITDVDPMEYGLMMERFLNPERISMPDFDIDFCMRGRERVVDYVMRKYGSGKVARIGTFGTMKAKLAVRDTARAMGIDPDTINRFGKLIPNEARGGQGDHAVTLAKCLAPDAAFTEEHLEELKKFQQAYNSDRDFHRVVNRAVEIEGIPKSTGVHAAGVLIWDQPLSSIVPLQKKKVKLKAADDDEEDDFDGDDSDTVTLEVTATQWSDKQVESLGLVKYDFLGLRTLTVIHDTLKSIETRTGRRIDWDEIDKFDPETFDMLSDGDTFGVFQLSEDGMRGFTQSFKPRSIEDIATISALFRPGPLDNGMVSQILNVRAGKIQPEYPIEALREILEVTNGVLTYQEQVLAIARVLSGYSLGEADMLRRAIGKKIPSEMAAQRTRFIEGAVKNGHSNRMATQMFEIIEKFADYCFNKSHAIAYSVLSFRTAWLKKHYPADFYAASMSSYDNLAKIRPFILDARKHDIRILPPDVNESDLSFTAIDNFTIRFGLMAIRGCGDSAVMNLIQARKSSPFISLIDFCKRIDPSCVKKNNLIALAQAGAFDEVEGDMNRLEIEEYVPLVMDAVKPDQQAQKKNQMTMFDALFDGPELGIVVRKPKLAYDKALILENEQTVLGLYITGSPLDNFLSIKESIEIDDVGSLSLPDLYVTLLVIINDVVIRNGKKGQFAFLKLEDQTGLIEAKVWSNVFDSYHDQIHKGACVVVRGKTNLYRRLEVVVDSIIPADKEQSRTTKRLVVNKLTPIMCHRIASLQKGKTPIDLEIGKYRYRLGHFDLPPDFKAGLEK